MSVIFRRIRGRLVPIKITSEKSPSGFIKVRKITAKAVGLSDHFKAKHIGHMYLELPKRGIHANIHDVRVREGFKRRGIGTALFEHAAKLAGRIGKKFLRATEIQHPSQVGIRNKHGKSVFIGHGFGKYGEESKKLKKGIVRQTVKDFKHQVQATTMIKKNLRRKK